MKLKNIKSEVLCKPFVKTKDLEIALFTNEDKITGFKIIIKGIVKIFKVKKDGDPLPCFIEMEKFADKQLSK